MRLAIRHSTSYSFAHPVAHGLQRLRLTPKATQGQTILDWRMEYEGATEQLVYEDQHVNTVALVSVDEGAQKVVVTCRGMVDTEDNAGVIGWHSGHLPLWAFLAQTKRTRPGPAMRKLVEQAKANEDKTIEQLHALSGMILEHL